MSDSDEVEKFLGLYGRDYEKLLLIVRKVCTQVQDRLGLSVVDNIYTRKQSTGGSNEYKEPDAIARKVRRAGQSVGAPAFLKLNDVVGLTVVAHYPDQLAAVIDEIRQSLANESCTTTDPEVHKANKGYFARHVVCSKPMAGETLQCEIQFKTMLHDAWSAKMHDLTYKPMGTLDPRLSALMASIADTIESVENQSCLVRDLIRSGWNVEGETRRAARQTIFEEVLRYHDHIMQAPEKEALGSLYPELVSLYQDIESQSEILKTECIDHRDAEELRKRVAKVCEHPTTLRYGWMMAGRIASARSTPDLSRFFMKYADMWLKAATELLADRAVEEKEMSAVPLVFYVIGTLDRAIDYGAKLLNARDFECLSSERKAIIGVNHAYFLAEREYHFPTQDERTRAHLKNEIDSMLGAPELAAKPEWAASLLDTKGFVKVTFARTKEEVRDGIEECLAAQKHTPDSQKNVGDAYADLNMRLGWRRYFELGARNHNPALPPI